MRVHKEKECGKKVKNKRSVTFRIAPELKSIFVAIAQAERRSFSSQINMALEDWIQLRNELHPRFAKDINESLNSGKPESLWKG